MEGRAIVGAKKIMFHWEPKTLQPKNFRARELLAFTATIIIASWQMVFIPPHQLLIEHLQLLIKWLEASPAAVNH